MTPFHSFLHALKLFQWFCHKISTKYLLKYHAAFSQAYLKSIFVYFSTCLIYLSPSSTPSVNCIKLTSFWGCRLLKWDLIIVNTFYNEIMLALRKWSADCSSYFHVIRSQIAIHQILACQILLFWAKSCENGHYARVFPKPRAAVYCRWPMDVSTVTIYFLIQLGFQYPNTDESLRFRLFICFTLLKKKGFIISEPFKTNEKRK